MDRQEFFEAIANTYLNGEADHSRLYNIAYQKTNKHDMKELYEEFLIENNYSRIPNELINDMCDIDEIKYHCLLCILFMETRDYMMENNLDQNEHPYPIDLCLTEIKISEINFNCEGVAYSV